MQLPETGLARIHTITGKVSAWVPPTNIEYSTLYPVLLLAEKANEVSVVFPLASVLWIEYLTEEEAKGVQAEEKKNREKLLAQSKEGGKP